MVLHCSSKAVSSGLCLSACEFSPVLCSLTCFFSSDKMSVPVEDEDMAESEVSRCLSLQSDQSKDYILTFNDQPGASGPK